MWARRLLPAAVLRLPALRRDAARMDAAGFAEAFARGFLLVHGSPGGPQGPFFRTRSIPPSDAVDDSTGPLDVGVLALVRRATATNSFVGIGRLDGNDVCLPDDTVSKLHAIVREEGGQLTILDARSRNGTAIDGVAIPARGEGAPTVLRSGQSIRFGSVVTSYLDAAALRDLVLRLA